MAGYGSAPTTARRLIVVTGASGYGGSWIVKKLLDAGHEVRALDLRRSPSVDDRAIFYSCDITDPPQLTAPMRGADVVVHTAAIVPYNLARAFGAAELQRVNVQGTANVLEAAKRAGTVTSFVYLSSTGVVFKGVDIKAGTEEGISSGAAEWNDAYSRSKAEAEHLVLQANEVTLLTAAQQATQGGAASAVADAKSPSRSSRAKSPGRASAAAAAAPAPAAAPKPASGRRGMATLALRPNGIFGPGEQHHTPKLLLTAGLGACSSLMGPTALTDYTHRDNLALAVIRAVEALEGPNAASVAGRPFFATDGWPCHTIEGFSPLLEALGFGSPYECAIATVSTNPSTSTSMGPLTTYLSQHPHLWRQAVHECGACRVPLAVLEASVKAGESVRITPQWAASLEGKGSASAAPADDVPSKAPLSAEAPVSARKRQRSASPKSAAGARKAAAAPAPLPSSSVSGPTKEILITAEAAFPKRLAVPDIAVQLGAVVMEGLAGLAKVLTLGAYRPEPFLTLADTRKVLRSNYFLSHAAMRELGYKPVTQPAQGIREMAPYYRAAGYSGEVRSPPAGVWASVIIGLGLNAAVGYNVRGVLDQALAVGLPLLGKGALAGLPVVGGMSTAELGLAAGWLVRVIFWAAILCHLLQGAWAFAYALRNKKNASAYGFNSAVCGFGATQLLVAHANPSSTANVPLLCISLFVACVPLVAALDAAFGGLL